MPDRTELTDAVEWCPSGAPFTEGGGTLLVLSRRGLACGGIGLVLREGGAKGWGLGLRP